MIWEGNGEVRNTPNRKVRAALYHKLIAVIQVCMEVDGVSLH